MGVNQISCAEVEVESAHGTNCACYHCDFPGQIALKLPIDGEPYLLNRLNRHGFKGSIRFLLERSTGENSGGLRKFLFERNLPAAARPSTIGLREEDTGDQNRWEKSPMLHHRRQR